MIALLALVPLGITLVNLATGDKKEFDRIRTFQFSGETPIWIGHSLEHAGPAEVLVNLHAAPPPYFSRFERLAEIVGADADAAAAGRERWKFYKARGYELRQHNLSPKD